MTYLIYLSPLLQVCIHCHVFTFVLKLMPALSSYKDDGTDVSKMLRPRFASEYGFQAMPHFGTIRKVSSPSDWHSNSPLMVMRNHHEHGQDEILLQIRYRFKWPIVPPLDMSVDMFDQFCYLSQCSQALTVQAQTEHYRRLRGSECFCMGALYWQCNDICEWRFIVKFRVFWTINRLEYLDYTNLT